MRVVEQTYYIYGTVGLNDNKIILCHTASYLVLLYAGCSVYISYTNIHLLGPCALFNTSIKICIYSHDDVNSIVGYPNTVVPIIIILL